MMRRRQLLQTAASAIGLAAGMGIVTAADDDADPRAEPHAGTSPSPNVPTVETGALGQDPFNEQSELPAGKWIDHNNGWGGPRESLRPLANASVQTYSIDGEEFVLDSFDDWDHIVNDDGSFGLNFQYITPPKPKGTTYEIRWEFEWKDDPLGEGPDWENVFPFWNQVEVVGRR